MVQKKVPSKLGIQAEHVKSEKLLGNLKKQTSCQLQEGKNRGPEMKKKMKRSRSIKLSDIESMRSTPLRKPISQPGKPPPLSSTPPTLERQSMIRTTDASPNYMKGTTSSEARKERSPVSSSASHVGSDCKNSRNRSSKIGSCSGNKPIRSLTRSASLKLVRTLTKSPSFKPARGTAKKCSRVAFCAADMDVQRDTCSSTLKDSKFPEYLMLNPGGSEAEGTSVIKVCSYTYCSLNGHHHTPLPPLKCFLKAKRRSLKAQKSVKLEALSPRKSKMLDDGAEEIDRELAGSSVDKKLSNEETESAGMIKIPVIHEVGNDFFVEIYAKGAEKRTEKTECWKDGELEEPDQLYITDVVELEQEDEEQEKLQVEDSDQECSDNLCYTPLTSEVESKESFEESNNDLVDMDVIGEFLAKKQQVEDSDAEDPPVLLEQEGTIGNFQNGSDIEEECHVSLRDYDSFSEFTEESNNDMEWEEDRSSVSEDHKEDTDLDKQDDSLTEEEEFLSDAEILDSLDTKENFEPDDMVSNGTEEILVNEVRKDLFGEETASFNTECYNCDLEMDGITESFEILESTQNDQPCSTEDASNEETSLEKDNKAAEAYLINIIMTLDSAEEPTVESTVVSANLEAEIDFGETNLQLEGAENDCTSDTSTVASSDDQEKGPLQADHATMFLHDQFSDSSLEKTVNESTVETDGDFCNNRELEDSACKLDDINQDSYSLQTLADGSKTTDPHNGPLKEEHAEAYKVIINTPKEFEEQSNSMVYLNSYGGNNTAEVDNVEEEVFTKSDAAETFLAACNGTEATSKGAFRYSRSKVKREAPETCNNRRWTIGCMKSIIKDLEQERKFNPKEPNFLPVTPDPDAEKIDLKHQMIDDRKNAEEWMLDHALQQAVSKLAPARKRKVALLVEAFETVLPTPKWEETRIRRASNTFSQTRPIQACS